MKSIYPEQVRYRFAIFHQELFERTGSDLIAALEEKPDEYDACIKILRTLGKSTIFSAMSLSVWKPTIPVPKTGDLLTLGVTTFYMNSQHQLAFERLTELRITPSTVIDDQPGTLIATELDKRQFHDKDVDISEIDRQFKTPIIYELQEIELKTEDALDTALSAASLYLDWMGTDDFCYTQSQRVVYPS